MIYGSYNEHTNHDTVGRLPDAYLVLIAPHSVKVAMMGAVYQL
jgi:hypothetical protein